MRVTVARWRSCSVLAALLAMLSAAIASGVTTPADSVVADLMARMWIERLHPLFQVIAVLGGIELTTLLLVGIAIYLRRQSAHLALLAFAIVMGLEILLKKL